MAPERVEVPAAPSFLPPELKKKWEGAYADGLKQAQEDSPNDLATQKQAAAREANRLVRVPECKSAADVKALADWQVIRREEVGGQIKCVTIDGKKYAFDVTAPAPAKNPAPKSS